MISLFPRKNRLEQLESNYTRLLKRSYHTAEFNKEESRRARLAAESVLQEIQGLLHTMVVA